MPSKATIRRSAVLKDKRRLRELHKCQTNLWYLLTKKLKYGWDPKAGRYGKGLTEQFHKPICDWIDKHDDKPFLGMWFARARHKTTIWVGYMIQQWLRDPNRCILYWHAVDERATEVAEECAKHFLYNTDLRALDPVGVYPDDYEITEKRGHRYRIFPPSTKKRWYNSNGFVITARHNNHKIRWRSLLARGAGSETTGAHGDIAVVDDPIGKNDIEDNQLPKKAAWFRNTVIPVVDDHRYRISGTPWSDWGMYQEWQDDPDWYTLSVPGSTRDCYVDDPESPRGNRLDFAKSVSWRKKKIHLKPDYDCEHPVAGTPEFREKQIERLNIEKRQMKGEFGPQVMVDPSPPGARPWDRLLCEHYIGRDAEDGKPGIKHPGVIAVLSDPAPVFVGSADGVKEKTRGDGSKDKWAIAVVKIWTLDDVLTGVLLDGVASREWSTPDGMDEACRMMAKWRTGWCIHEAYGGLSQKYDLEMQSAVKRNRRQWPGLRWRRKLRNKVIQFAASYASGAKNNRIVDLAKMAEAGDFYIYEKCPKDFLFGSDTKMHDGFLPQMREFVPLGKGRNSLRFDDEADVTARLQDPILLDIAPHQESEHEFKGQSPYRPLVDESAHSWGTRHIRV